MTTLATNMIFAAAWAILFGGFNWLTMTSGLVVGYFTLWLLQPLTGTKSSYFRRVWYWIKLIIMFHYELLMSSIQVLWDVITPTHRANPAFIEVPLDVKTDAGIFLVTNLITLTPGTLSIDVSPDRSTLTIHAMFADDPEAVCHELKSGMEKWVIDAVEERE